jgi:hypothetical protein
VRIKVTEKEDHGKKLIKDEELQEDRHTNKETQLLEDPHKVE